MKTEIKKSELSKIPFIDSLNIKDRVLTTLIFFDKGEWHFWLPVLNGLKRFKGEPAESNYFAQEPEKNTDIYYDFLNFMNQRACWKEVMLPINGIQNDIHNLGSSLGKLNLFYNYSLESKKDVRRFVSTEIEYVFGVCRSIFDLLQEIISKLWLRIELFDNNINKNKLPPSFRRMVLQDDKLMNIDSINNRYNIPIELASFYFQYGSFFQMLRKYRDDVVHNGKDFSSIFITDKGFAINSGTQPFASFGVWNDKHMLPNNLASLRPPIAYVIKKTLTACEDFSKIIQNIIKFPPEIVPGFRLFIRGYHNQQLLEIEDVINQCKWWGE